MPFSRFHAVGLLLAVWHPGFAAEPQPKDELIKKYRELIQQLVSPNKAAFTRNGDNSSSVSFSPKYDREAQRRIHAERQVHYDNFEEALPLLVEALDDKRYCMTIVWGGGGYYNKSVGDICRNLIASQLEVYRDQMRCRGPSEWHRYDYAAVSQEWWQARQGRSLAELQIEAIDWAIERRTAELGAKGEHEISKLEQLRDEIAKSAKPAKAMRMVSMVPSEKQGSPE